MATIAEALALGLRCHQSGDLQQAISIYRQILQTNPENGKVLALLGLALLTVGQFEDAVVSLCHAVQHAPEQAGVWNNLGIALARLGRLDKAVASYERALQVEPQYAEAHYNLANALAGLDRLEEATSAYKKALDLKSGYAKAYRALGAVLARREHLDEAAASFREALRLRPDDVEATRGLALALAGQGKSAETIPVYERFLQLTPNQAEAHNNLGAALHDADRLEEAANSYREALRLKPGFVEAHNNLGLVLGEVGSFDEASAEFEEAVRLMPDYAEAHKNLGLALLTLGRFERGWREYEWRLRCADTTLQPLPQPIWNGSDLTGRTILLRAEQALGDTLQIIRFASLVKKRGGRVLVECQPPLVPLLAGCAGVDQLLAQGSVLPEYDVQAGLLSLPRILGTSLESIPAEIPYLLADARLVEHWRNRLSDVRAFKIGINWQGSVFHRRSRQRSIPLAQMTRLKDIEGVCLFSLQKGAGSDQLGTLPDGAAIVDLGKSLDETTGPFLDTAAVLMNLDLLITSDTAIAHLAGALGVRVWVALPYSADWRWFLDREDSPWYPSMRLFRQQRFADWPEVFDRTLAELKKFVGSR